MTFKGQTVWLTGASSGIGEACAKGFAKTGAHVILSGRDASALDRTAEACRAAGAAGVYVIPFDVVDLDRLPALTELAFAQTGRVDLLFLNAGISQRSDAIDTPLENYRKIMEVNFFATIAHAKAALPKMIAQGGGRIAVTSSVMGKFGAQLRSGYCASKHALQGFFDVLRAETYGSNIRVSLITPGWVKTQVSARALTATGEPTGQMGDGASGGMTPDAAAAVILKGLANGRDEIPVGEGKEMLILKLNRFAPGLVRKIMRRIRPT